MLCACTGTHVPVQEDTSIILLWEINTGGFCTCHDSEAHFSFKFPFGMEFQDSQEKVVRIRIKQSIWDCRAGIDSGLARKKIYIFGRSSVGETVSWEWMCLSTGVVQTWKYFTEILSTFIPASALSYQSERGDWQEQGKQQVHRQLPWLQRGRAPQHPSPALSCRQLHRKQWAADAPPKPSLFKAWLIGKLALLHRDIP